MNNVLPPMLNLLKSGIDAGGFQTDDVLATVLPLFRQTLAVHQAGFVAPLDRAQGIEVTPEQRLTFSEAEQQPAKRNASAINKIQDAGPKRRALLRSSSSAMPKGRRCFRSG